MPAIGQAPHHNVLVVGTRSELGAEEELDGAGASRDVDMAMMVAAIGVVRIGRFSIEERSGFLSHMAGGFGRHLASDSSCKRWDCESC